MRFHTNQRLDRDMAQNDERFGTQNKDTEAQWLDVAKREGRKHYVNVIDIPIWWALNACPICGDDIELHDYFYVNNGTVEHLGDIVGCDRS